MIFGEQSRHGATLSASARRTSLWGLMTALFCVLLLSAGCGGGGGGGNNNNNNNNTATIVGRVIDQNTSNSAVANARITVNAVVYTTASDGTFAVSIPANQALTVRVAGPTNADGTAAYYQSGYVGATQYSLASSGFTIPATALTTGGTYNVGDVIIFAQSGPPPPPPI